MVRIINIDTKTHTLRVSNGKDDLEWFTTDTGSHVPLKKGQSKAEAIKEHFGDGRKSGKSDWEKQFGPLDKPLSKSAIKRIQKEDFEKNVRDADRRNAEEKASKAREKALKDQEEAGFQAWKKQQPAKKAERPAKEEKNDHTERDLNKIPISQMTPAEKKYMWDLEQKKYEETQKNTAKDTIVGLRKMIEKTNKLIANFQKDGQQAEVDGLIGYRDELEKSIKEITKIHRL